MTLRIFLKHFSGMIAKDDQDAQAIKGMSLVCDVLSNIDNHEKHCALRKFLETIPDEEVKANFAAYYNEYEELMYMVSNGWKIWYNSQNQKHRVALDANGLTKPAAISNNGDMEWLKNDKLHRIDKGADGLTLPAKILSDKKVWAINGQTKRTDVDANGKMMYTRIDSDGKMFWHSVDGFVHREERGEDGLTLPAIIHPNGTMMWYMNAKPHRLDKDEFGNFLPAHISKTTKIWYLNGEKHRAELGKNPNDAKTFGKVLPAKIEDKCHNIYFYHGALVSAETIKTKMEEQNKPISGQLIEKIHIEMLDGSVIELEKGVKTLHITYV